MDALLAAMTRKRRGVAIAAIGGGAAATGAIVLAVVLSNRTTAPVLACPEPVLVPERVWSDEIALEMRGKNRGVEAQMIAADMAAWREQRETACRADGDARRLPCLDG